MRKRRQFPIRCTPEELADLDARAEATGLSRQMYVYARLWGEPPQAAAMRSVYQQQGSEVAWHRHS